MAERSAIGKLLAAQPRKTYEYEINGFFAFKEPVSKIAIRVPTKREQDMAMSSARTYVKKYLEKNEAPENIPEFTQDAMSAAIVATCCLDPSQEMLPVWPTIDVVCEDLTADRIGVLVRLVNEVRAKDGPTPIEIDDDRVEAMANLAAATSGTEASGELLAPIAHTYLVHLYMLTAVKYVNAMDEIRSLTSSIDALKNPPTTAEEADHQSD
jgi:hypothetical protein